MKNMQVKENMRSLVLVFLLQCSLVLANVDNETWCSNPEEQEDSYSSTALLQSQYTFLAASEVFRERQKQKLQAANSDTDEEVVRVARSISGSKQESDVSPKDFVAFFAFAGRAASTLASPDHKAVAKSFVEEYERQHTPLEGDQRSDGQKFFEYVEAGVLTPDSSFKENVRRFKEWAMAKYGAPPKMSAQKVDSLMKDIFCNSTIPEISEGYDFSVDESG